MKEREKRENEGIKRRRRKGETRETNKRGGNRYTVEKRNKFPGFVLAAIIKYNTH